MKRIGLVNYDSGNLHSVENALRREGADVRLVGGPDGFDGLDALVLPGVGAFGDAVRSLHNRGLWGPIASWLRDDRPFLGICVGCQLLFDESDESPGAGGFGLFAGRVVRFGDAPGLKVPHMGWNTLDLVEPGRGIWRGLPSEPYVFFVHSFYPAPADRSVVTAWCDYNGRFAASVGRGSVQATQFHPEKSQDVGLALLRNFLSGLES